MKAYSYLIVLCLLGLLFSPSVHAQTGIKVGGNLSRLGQSIGGTVPSITQTQVGEFKGGWQVGVWHHVVFSPKLGLGVEANYTGRNEYYDILKESSSTRQINIPVFVYYKLHQSLFAEIGGAFNYVFNTRIRTFYQSNTITAGLIAGLHYRISPKVLLNARYEYDIAPAYENKPGAIPPTLGITLNTQKKIQYRVVELSLLFQLSNK